ncbi:MAG: GNAT family N-acetyltransferase [Mycobacterium sp.]|nr:GNAT family N-acetyltransferase [Mycobacterium sp.]
MPEPSIRIPTGSDVERIKQIAVAAGMFSPEEAGFIDDMLAGFFDGSLAGHRWVVVDDTSGRASAAAHYAPEPFADRVWNLYFIAVAPDKQGHGLGCSLIHHLERELTARGDDVARVLIVETSATDQYAATRTFYRNRGYREEARIRQFYGPADDKIVFWKSLVEDTGSPPGRSSW